MNAELAIFTAVFTLLGVSLMMLPRGATARSAPRLLRRAPVTRLPRPQLLFSPTLAPVALC